MKHQIEATLEELRRLASHGDVSAPAISKWSVGMHIQHCFMSMISICGALDGSDEHPPKPRRSIAKTFVFMTGIIPKGKARAARGVRPELPAEQESLLKGIDEASAALLGTYELPKNRWVEHPYFGPLRRDQALRFVLIHNRHHLKIARNILTYRIASS